MQLLFQMTTRLEMKSEIHEQTTMEKSIRERNDVGDVVDDDRADGVQAGDGHAVGDDIDDGADDGEADDDWFDDDSFHDDEVDDGAESDVLPVGDDDDTVAHGVYPKIHDEADDDCGDVGVDDDVREMIPDEHDVLHGLVWDAILYDVEEHDVQVYDWNGQLLCRRLYCVQIHDDVDSLRFSLPGLDFPNEPQMILANDDASGDKRDIESDT